MLTVQTALATRGGRHVAVAEESAESRNVDTIQFLLACGASVNVSDDEGDTIIHGTKIPSV
jgi:hypothetical protein